MKFKDRIFILILIFSSIIQSAEGLSRDIKVKELNQDNSIVEISKLVSDSIS